MNQWIVNQWLINRYIKGQNKYKKVVFDKKCDSVFKGFIKIYMSDNSVFHVSLYDFLFNPEWGFAKAFWGDKYCIETKTGRPLPYPAELATDSFSDMKMYQYHLQQMVISKDPLKYLEQFKDK